MAKLSERRTAAQQLAVRLMREFGVDRAIGASGAFVFNWNRRTRFAGLCVDPTPSAPGRIELSLYFVELNPMEEVEETIRHEIAHALAGAWQGHNEKWVEACNITGARPNQFCDAVMPNKDRFTSSCSFCSHTFSRRENPGTSWGTCGKCSRFSQFVWAANALRPK